MAVISGKQMYNKGEQIRCGNIGQSWKGTREQGPLPHSHPLGDPRLKCSVNTDIISYWHNESGMLKMYVEYLKSRICR